MTEPTLREKIAANSVKHYNGRYGHGLFSTEETLEALIQSEVSAAYEHAAQIAQLTPAGEWGFVFSRDGVAAAIRAAAPANTNKES